MPHVETPGRNPLIYTAMDILDFTFFINQPHHFISGGWQAVFIVWVYVCGNFQQTANLLFPRTAVPWLSLILTFEMHSSALKSIIVFYSSNVIKKWSRP